MTIYTPGSTAGVPLNIVGSLRAPPLSWETEAETLRDEIEGTVTSLLALVGITADPLASREHVLLSNLIENAWRAGRDLDLGTLIGEIQSPPLRKLGVFEIDQFFPPDRPDEARVHAQRPRRLAVVRGLGRGRAARPAALLFTATGSRAARSSTSRTSPRRSASSSSTLVFSKLVTWMRGQAGHARPARARVHGRGVRLRTADGGAACEEADPDDLQAGPRVRARARALDPEPGRPRLQGDVERRHVARRPPPDGERQGAGARGAPLGGGRRRTSPRSTRRSAASASASSCSSRRRPNAPRLFGDALGDVVPPRAADEGAGARLSRATRGSAAGAGGARSQPTGRAPPRPPPRRARRRRDDRRAARAAGVAGLVPRPGGAVGAADRRAAGVDAAARVPRRTRLAPLRRQRRGRRRAARSSRRSTGRSTAASTSRARRRSTTTTATSAPTPPAARPTSSPRRPSASDVLHAGGEGHPAPPRRQPPARAAAQPGAEARLAPRRDGARTFARAATPPRRSGPTPRRRRSATDSRRSGTGSRARSRRRSGASRSSTRTRERARRTSSSPAPAPCLAPCSAAAAAPGRWRARSAARHRGAA